MRTVIYLLKKYPFSCACICAVWILSLMPIFPETPLDGIQFIDKWTHLVMYGGLSLVIWLEYLRRHSKANLRRAIIFAVVIPILMGGLLEILQKYCTDGCRSGEWLDFVADSIGVLVVLPIGLFLSKRLHAKS